MMCMFASSAILVIQSSLLGKVAGLWETMSQTKLMKVPGEWLTSTRTHTNMHAHFCALAHTKIGNADSDSQYVRQFNGERAVSIVKTTALAENA